MCFLNLLIGSPECTSLPLPNTGQREGGAFMELCEQIEKPMLYGTLFQIWVLCGTTVIYLILLKTNHIRIIKCKESEY